VGQLYRIRLVLVGPVEPVAQIRCCLVGRLAVEGHHRGWDARNPDEMRTPAFFGDPRHFNDEGSAGNNSFETVVHGVYVSEVKTKEEQKGFYAVSVAKQAKRSTKARSNRNTAAFVPKWKEKKSHCL
jgi:hypothetical protein